LAVLDTEETKTMKRIIRKLDKLAAYVLGMGFLPFELVLGRPWRECEFYKFAAYMSLFAKSIREMQAIRRDTIKLMKDLGLEIPNV